MNQAEKRRYLIDHLLKENPQYQKIEVPSDDHQQWRLLRALMNVRPSAPISEEFQQIQDSYLQTVTAAKGIVKDRQFPVGINLWQGDITRLGTDAIVNAANSGMTGCYVPNHSCIDNAIHTFAGIELRNRCQQIMTAQGHPEPTGQAQITPAYNLPCQFVIHTVGPVVEGLLPSEAEVKALASSYRNCLKLADQHHLGSIAFPCISTGIFHFPHYLAARIAVREAKHFLATHSNLQKVIFNVFQDQDKQIYQRLLA